MSCILGQIQAYNYSTAIQEDNKFVSHQSHPGSRRELSPEHNRTSEAEAPRQNEHNFRRRHKALPPGSRCQRNSCFPRSSTHHRNNSLLGHSSHPRKLVGRSDNTRQISRSRPWNNNAQARKTWGSNFHLAHGK